MQNCAFFLSFFSSFYRESEFLPRWEQVLEELKTKGIYDLTFEELEFGVRTAWRNAARCSARIQWENLVILINNKLVFFNKKLRETTFCVFDNKRFSEIVVTMFTPLMTCSKLFANKLNSVPMAERLGQPLQFSVQDSTEKPT